VAQSPPAAEGLTRVGPVALARLVGLGRAPEARAVRRRMEALAGLQRSEGLWMALARHHAAGHPEAMGVPSRRRPRPGLPRRGRPAPVVPTRARAAMAATTGTWLADHDGSAVGGVAPAARCGAHRLGCGTRARAVRELVGPDARPTICLDREGWGPALLTGLVGAGLGICTAPPVGRPAPSPARPSPPTASRTTAGHDHEHLLADGRSRVGYDQRRHCLACRQVTRLGPSSGTRPRSSPPGPTWG